MTKRMMPMGENSATRGAFNLTNISSNPTSCQREFTVLSAKRTGRLGLPICSAFLGHRAPRGGYRRQSCCTKKKTNLRAYSFFSLRTYTGGTMSKKAVLTPLDDNIYGTASNCTLFCLSHGGMKDKQFSYLCHAHSRSQMTVLSFHIAYKHAIVRNQSSN